MRHPTRVYDAQHDLVLHLVKDIFRNLVLLVLVNVEHLFGDHVDHATGLLAMIELVKIELDARELLEPGVEPLDVPVS